MRSTRVNEDGRLRGAKLQKSSCTHSRHSTACLTLHTHSFFSLWQTSPHPDKSRPNHFSSLAFSWRYPSISLWLPPPPARFPDLSAHPSCYLDGLLPRFPWPLPPFLPKTHKGINFGPFPGPYPRPTDRHQLREYGVVSPLLRRSSWSRETLHCNGSPPSLRLSSGL